MIPQTAPSSDRSIAKWVSKSSRDRGRIPEAPDASFVDLDLLYAEARAQLDNQLSSMDAMDTKIGIIVGLGGAELAVAAAALAIPRPANVSTWLLIVVGIALAAALASYLVLAGSGILALNSMQVRIGPQLDQLGAVYARGQTSAVVKARVVRTLRDDFVANEWAARRIKDRTLRRCLIAVVIETLMVVIAFVLLSVTGIPQALGAAPATHETAFTAAGSSPALSP